MMTALKNLFCLLLIAVSGHCSTETLVPFIAWSSSNDLSAISSNQPATVEEFVRGTELSTVECFVVFKTSQLSFDDIVKFGGAYGEKHAALASLQSNLQSAKSSLWVGMRGELSTNLISSLSFNYDLSPQHVTDADEVSLNHGTKQLIVVFLPEGDGEESRFMEQDKIISRVMAAITQSKKHYIAFYTADHSSRQNPQMEVFVQSKREANNFNTLDYLDDLEGNATGTVCAMVGNGTSTANGRRCAMMCLKTPILMVQLDKSGAIKNHTDHADYISFIDGSCLRGNQSQKCSDEVAPYLTIRAIFNQSDPVTFRFTFIQGAHVENCSVSSGFWMISLDVDGEEYVRNNRSQLFTKFEVPVGASYACGVNAHNVFRPVDVPNANETVFTGYWFSGIQAQVGGVFTPTSFASAYNCESYLSHVSLMGVVAVLILLAVLYCSTVFMFQMKSMDRFDDPRGPTISVENLH